MLANRHEGVNNVPSTPHLIRELTPGTEEYEAVVEDYPVLGVCQKHKLFEGHSPERLREVVSKMVPIKLRPGEVLFRVGDKGTDMFVLQSGELACMSRENKEVKVLKAGECFGELTVD